MTLKPLRQCLCLAGVYSVLMFEGVRP